MRNCCFGVLFTQKFSIASIQKPFNDIRRIWLMRQMQLMQGSGTVVLQQYYFYKAHILLKSMSTLKSSKNEIIGQAINDTTS